jgi:hypothetical protein
MLCVFSDLQAAHPGLHGLQSLLAGLSLPARDGDEPELLVAAAISNPADIQSQSASWAQGQVCQILARLSRHSQGEGKMSLQIHKLTSI